ncbi:hypothetical protein OGATHE_003496 [Ogataea polymorpha]|uniref:Uncharacterized protein n=1 Tax=Ogataea polymorpha TaxID=460523 RepID=A0A9P8T3F8_9ASCO|nr:hypothetical protein OGATHE_003496 [Ogataea polymorpha]
MVLCFIVQHTAIGDELFVSRIQSPELHDVDRTYHVVECWLLQSHKCIISILQIWFLEDVFWDIGFQISEATKLCSVIMEIFFNCARLVKLNSRELGVTGGVGTPVDVERRGLVVSENQSLSNNSVLLSSGSKDNQFCNIISIQWLCVLVNGSSSFFVTLEPNQRKLLSGNVTRLDLDDSNLGVDQFFSQGAGEEVQRRLGSTVDAAARVSLSTCNRAQLYDITLVALLHLLDDQLRQLNHSQNIGLKHLLHIGRINRTNRIETQSLTSIVDQDIDLRELLGQTFEEWGNLVGLRNV